MIKNVIHHIIDHTFFSTIRKKIYVKRKNKKNISDKDYLVGLGKIQLKYKMNLENPQTFNEKINWYKINYCNDLMKKVVDKIESKNYVISKGYSDIIVKTIGIFNTIDEIDFSVLPEKFVVKNTLDSGGVYVCHDKKLIDIDKIKMILQSKLDIEYINGKHWARENAYTPNLNRIIVEELIETPDNHSPWDYKFFCFNGEPQFLFVGSDRDTNVCFDFFDINFNCLYVKQGHPN